MGKLFGTDGVRGVAGKELDCETVMRLGKAVAGVAIADKQDEGKARVLIGKDTRASSDVMEAALIAGICSAGADACVLGALPTQGVSMLTERYGADAGIMITASHSAAEYNGIKIFERTGFRISAKAERELEELVFNDKWQKISAPQLGRIQYEEKAEWDYIRRVMKMVGGDLRGLKIAVDCGNGAASRYAKNVLEGLGASCVMLGCDPDGENINIGCGTHDLGPLKQAVIKRHCDIGLAFDGDGSKCIAMDENGGVIDGDKQLAIFAKFLKVQGKLNANTIVATVMSNLGLTQFCEREGINITATGVGSGNVVERMLRFGYNLGGEQNGHIIFFDCEKIGDGIVTGARLCEVLKKSRRKASELASIVRTCPQKTVNVPMPPEKRGVWAEDAGFREMVSAYKKKLGTDGRIIVRESGTENCVRIMIEGTYTGVITEYANMLEQKLTEVMNYKSEKQLATEAMLQEIRDETDNGLRILPELKT